VHESKHMAFTTQSDVDAAYADLECLLDERRPVDPSRLGLCVVCSSDNLVPMSGPGQTVSYYHACGECGVVQPGVGVPETLDAHSGKRSSNYKRIHHWHERVSQLMLCESGIPDDKFLQIATCLCDGTHAVVNKDAIRSVLRSLNMQLYIEKWLQIIQRLTGIEPPKPGGMLLQKLDDMFIDLQRPFYACKDGTKRKNFLNYNYVFCRLFQALGCSQFCMFFPLIKSKQKLRVLDDMWMTMANSIGWDVKALKMIPPFAVKLEQPELLLTRIAEQCAARAAVGPRTEPFQKGFRKSDHRLLAELDRKTRRSQHRSTRPELELQRLGPPRKKLRLASGAVLRL
jgi:hypothetical protein